MSNDLTKDEIVKMAREAGCAWLHEPLAQRFATLCRAPLVAEVERLTADLEQTRVQLAGCGVAAMQNTEESKAHRVERGAYGWSESYGDVCRMVDREIELRAENARLKDDYQNACKTVAEMHAAAVGQIVGPNRGVVEDVADLRAERDDWKARAEAAEAELARVRAQEPFGWYSAKEDDFMLDKIRKTHERLNSHTHRIGKYDTALFTAPQPAAQEPTSAVPVVEQLVLAATAVIDYDESDPDDGVTMMLNYADALAKCRDAIAAGQKFIKENGK